MDTYSRFRTDSETVLILGEQEGQEWITRKGLTAVLF